MSGPNRRKWVDIAARGGITAGGVAIVASIIGMLGFILAQTLPLWRRTVIEPRAALVFDPVASGPIRASGFNEYGEVAFRLDSTGGTSLRVLGETSARSASALDSLGASRITGSARLDPAGRAWILALDDGSLLHVTLDDGLSFAESGRRYDPHLAVSRTEPLGASSSAQLAAVSLEDGWVAAVLGVDRALRVVTHREKENFLGERRVEQSVRTLELPADAEIRGLALEYDAAHLVAGTSDGALLDYDLEDGASAPERIPVYAGTGITCLEYLNGRHSLAVGSARGDLEVWFRVRDEAGRVEMQRAHRFAPHPQAVEGIVVSLRDRSFVSWDEQGNAALRFATTAATRARFRLDGPAPHQLAYAAKGNGLLSVDAQGGTRLLGLSQGYPEFSWSALFGRVRYEGYGEAAYVWQSTGSTDEFEPKLSLVPLIFGTLKGMFYTLLFAVPIAIGASVYTALFMHPKLRSVIKPTMEMLAALPSVVLGFLAALWLAPLLANAMPIYLAFPILLPLVIIGTGLLWRRLPLRTRGRAWPGVESLLLVVALFAALRLVLWANPGLDGLFPGGFLDWVYRTFSMRYDQRNALVIGIAMGVAVIPIVFTISEDALGNVPRSLWAGSLAMGATPWQTAWHVMLPAASPGIFSAVMIGAGRAVGETMIVLMATGNTPILDGSPFNGFRSLAANIATEIPEAPVGGTLYRVLFLTALVLFLITFAANTVAEIVRHRLRQRYSRF